RKFKARPPRFSNCGWPRMTSVVSSESKEEPQNPSGRCLMQSHRVRIAKLSSKSLKRSKTSNKAQLVPLGRLVNTHGVHGELRFLPYALHCPTLQENLTVALQKKDDVVRLYIVESVRPHAPFLLVRFQGITSIAHAQVLRDCILAVEEHFLPSL